MIQFYKGCGLSSINTTLFPLSKPQVASAILTHWMGITTAAQAICLPVTIHPADVLQGWLINTPEATTIVSPPRCVSSTMSGRLPTPRSLDRLREIADSPSHKQDASNRVRARAEEVKPEPPKSIYTDVRDSFVPLTIKARQSRACKSWMPVSALMPRSGRSPSCWMDKSEREQDLVLHICFFIFLSSFRFLRPELLPCDYPYLGAMFAHVSGGNSFSTPSHRRM